MSPKTKKIKEKIPPVEPSVKSDHVLLEPDEWHDPRGRKVLGEYHKGSHPEDAGEETKEGQMQSSANEEKSDKQAHSSTIRRVIDLSTVELMAYTLTRAIFHQGVWVPIYMEGVVDMDIAVKDTDIIVNTNNVAFEPPPLQIWHIIFSYKGKPVMEYGRGVKNNLKIHYSRAVIFLMAVWLGGRKKRKAREKATLNACMDLAKNPPEKIEKGHEKKP